MAEKVLSVFIDESGTFGDCESHDDKYVIGLVFHNQKVDISANIKSFNDHLKMLGKDNHFVHTGPLIRREHPYENDLREQRIKLFSSLFNCSRRLPISYSHILIYKREWNNVMHTPHHHCPSPSKLLSVFRFCLQNNEMILPAGNQTIFLHLSELL